jgi:hypothetical protein
MKIVKILAVVAIVLFVLVVGGIFWGKNWVDHNLESVINSDPTRKYDFRFDQIEFDFFKKVILISEVKIAPVGVPDGVFVEGRVVQVYLKNFSVLKLILERELEIKELMFSQPEFVIYIPQGNPAEEKAGEAMKSLFGDVLSRGGIENFEVGRANGVVMHGTEQVGSFSNFNLIASELHTDSLKWHYPIPFDYGRIYISLDSLDYLLGNGQHLKTGKVSLDSRKEQFKLKDFSLTYRDDLKKVAKGMKFQTDLVEFRLDSLVLSGVEANSNLYSDLNVRARKLEVAGLKLEDFRNKDLPRPKDELKPLFQGMIGKITAPLKLDTLRITNAAFSYGETVAGKNESWKIHFNELNGDLVNITTVPEIQSVFKQFEGNFTAKIEGSGVLKIKLNVPYDRDEFDMELDFVNFPMPKINQVLKPIMQGDIVSGDLVRMNMKIHADPQKSSNTLRFDYTNLKIELFKKGTQKKNNLLSALANVAVNTSNLPHEKKYLTAEYSVVRNPNRGPFHLVWQSTKVGMMKIVQGGAINSILKSSEK